MFFCKSIITKQSCRDSSQKRWKRTITKWKVALIYVLPGGKLVRDHPEYILFIQIIINILIYLPTISDYCLPFPWTITKRSKNSQRMFHSYIQPQLLNLYSLDSSHEFIAELAACPCLVKYSKKRLGYLISRSLQQCLLIDVRAHCILPLFVIASGGSSLVLSMHSGIYSWKCQFFD